MINTDYCCLAFPEGTPGELLERAAQACGPATLVRLTFFTALTETEYIIRLGEEIRQAIKTRFGDEPPVWNLVAQAPATAPLAAEAHYRIMGPGQKPAYRTHRAIPYITIEGPARELLVTISAHNTVLPAAPTDQAAEIFARAAELMNAANFPVESIVRQWNYVEGITLTTDCSQHYQAMNDARSRFYATGNWENGYPAATGIGTENGGVSVEINAARGLLSSPIDNPLQRAAHVYTAKVLVAGNAPQPSTPKFERARTVDYPATQLTYISGTAAIRSEDSLKDADAPTQARVTIENIEALTARTGSTVTAARVYLKHPADYEKVKPIVEKSYPTAQLLFVKAEVCRPELLVEIEATAIKWG